MNQSNGVAIVASYGGAPKIKEEDKNYLDASLDTSFTSKYVNTNEFEKVEDKLLVFMKFIAEPKLTISVKIKITVDVLL